MIVAEVQALTSNGFLASAHGQHNIMFDDLVKAETEYKRIATLLERRDSKANDLPILIEIVGSGSKTSFPLADLRAIALTDYEYSNHHRSGVKERFPNLF